MHWLLRSECTTLVDRSVEDYVRPFLPGSARRRWVVPEGPALVLALDLGALRVELHHLPPDQRAGLPLRSEGLRLLTWVLPRYQLERSRPHCQGRLGQKAATAYSKSLHLRP